MHINNEVLKEKVIEFLKRKAKLRYELKTSQNFYKYGFRHR